MEKDQPYTLSDDEIARLEAFAARRLASGNQVSHNRTDADQLVTIANFITQQCETLPVSSEEERRRVFTEVFELRNRVEEKLVSQIGKDTEVEHDDDEQRLGASFRVEDIHYTILMHRGGENNGAMRMYGVWLEHDADGNLEGYHYWRMVLIPQVGVKYRWQNPQGKNYINNINIAEADNDTPLTENDMRDIAAVADRLSLYLKLEK